MSVTGIIPDRPYKNTHSDGDDYAMCVSGRLSVTTLHCLVDLRGTPEKYQFTPEGVPTVSRESFIKLRELFVSERKAEPRLEKFECEQVTGDRNYKRRSLRQDAQKGCPARPQPMKAPEA
jgi:hypothetical protein